MILKFGLLYLIFSVSNAHAFNWKKCREVFFAGGNGVGVFMSTTSYVSSTSECTAIGNVENQKKMFIVHNLDMLKSDSARGDGEYVKAYASLFNCTKSYEVKIPSIFKDNFVKIYGDNFVNGPESAYNSIENIMWSNEEFSENCKRGNPPT